MQCGPVRYKAERPATAPHCLEVHPRNRFQGIDLPSDAAIQDVFRYLAADTERTKEIVGEVIENYRLGRKVLLLTERTDHLDVLQVALLAEIPDIFLLHGRMSRKQRTAVILALDKLSPDAPRVLLATGSWSRRF